MGIQRAKEDVENLLGHLGDPAEMRPCPPVNVAGRNACVAVPLVLAVPCRFMQDSTFSSLGAGCPSVMV